MNQAWPIAWLMTQLLHVWRHLLATVPGLRLWEAKEAVDQREIESQKERSVKEQRATPPPLRIAGELEGVHGEVRVTFNANIKL